MIKNPIFVTEPSLPPLNELLPYLEKIWESRILTNGGPFHQKFEEELARYLGVEYISLFANGTLALITALQALRITGEVITTPYSFVATSHSLLWHGAKPIFVDIDKNTLNINPLLIESAITPQTTAIMAVHCYGNPCDTEKIQQIADIYNLKVIYDAAHSFGVRDTGGSILRHGDLSIMSFHATKVFNTFEGGAIVCPDAKTKLRIDNLKNFGFNDEVTVVAPGINGKMSEFNSALGLAQLSHISVYIEKRKEIDVFYREKLGNIKGIEIVPRGNQTYDNYSYFPILITPEFHTTRDEIYEYLKTKNIYTRRYFYPLISEFPMYRTLPSSSRQSLKTAYETSMRVLCLPIYPNLEYEDLMKIVHLLTDKNMRP